MPDVWVQRLPMAVRWNEGWASSWPLAPFHLGSEIEDGIQAAMDADECRDLPNGEQGPVRVRACAVPRIVTDRQPLIRHPEDDFGADDVTGQTNGVNLRAGNRGAAGLPRADRPHDRNCGFRVAHFRQAKRKLASSTAGCVDFVVLCIVDDLPLRDEPGRGFGELLEQHGRQGEVATGEYSTMLFAGEDVDLREIALRETGGSHHDVRTVLERGQDVGLGAIRFGVLSKTSQGLASASAAEA